MLLDTLRGEGYYGTACTSRLLSGPKRFPEPAMNNTPQPGINEDREF